MPEEDPRDGWNGRAHLVAGCTVGVLLGIGIVQTELLVSPSSATADFLGTSPENPLRVLQSVGILLPLVVGLLRFTTSEQSEVNERLNDHLLLGILGLVLAGASAVIASMFTAMTGVLKLSLLFVLFTFVVIGLAAGAMFGEFTTGTGSNEDARKGDGVDEEIDDTGRSDSEDAGDVGSPEAGVESETGSNEESEQTEDVTVE